MGISYALLPAALMIVAIACSKPKPSFDKIRPGMDEGQVVSLLGSPQTIANQARIKYLEYESFDRDIWLGSGRKENVQFFFVKLIDGKVDSFGRKGDFDSTKNPTREIKIEEKIIDSRPTSTTIKTFDLKSELLKIEQLKKDGLISDQEFKELRQHAIEKAKEH